MNAAATGFVARGLVLIFRARAPSVPLHQIVRILPVNTIFSHSLREQRHRAPIPISSYKFKVATAHVWQKESFDICFRTQNAANLSREGFSRPGSKEAVAMKTAFEVLAIILFAVPVAVLVIFDLPGLGAILAIIFLAIPFILHTLRGAADKGIQENGHASGNYAAHKHAA